MPGNEYTTINYNFCLQCFVYVRFVSFMSMKWHGKIFIDMKTHTPILSSYGHTKTFILNSCLSIFPASLFVFSTNHTLILLVSLNKLYDLTSLGLYTCSSLCFEFSGLSATCWMPLKTYSTHQLLHEIFLETLSPFLVH